MALARVVKVDYIELRLYLVCAQMLEQMIIGNLGKVGKATLLCPLWANRIAHFGHNIIVPCKVLVQGSILFSPLRYSGLS